LPFVLKTEQPIVGKEDGAWTNASQSLGSSNESKKINQGATNMSEQNKVSRRKFLKQAVVAGASATVLGTGALAGLGGTNVSAQTQCPATGIPDKWDLEADVVVVGYGGAGATAAIQAADAGAQVIIIEKAPQGSEGGNTGVSGGGWIQPTNADDAFTFIKAQMFGTASDDVIKGFVEELMGTTDFVKKLGGDVTLLDSSGAIYNWFPGVKGVNKQGTTGNGATLWKVLSDSVQSRKIQVLYETPGKHLIQDRKSKEILGVEAESKGKPLYIKAKRGVVMALGGWENNPEYQSNYFTPGVRLYPWGTPYNTGDGLKMVADVGAKLWHMGPLEYAPFGIKPASDELKVGVSIPSYPPASGATMFVDKYGKRFMNEFKSVGPLFAPFHEKEPLAVLDFDLQKIEYKHMPFFLLFDESFRKKGPIGETTRWSWQVIKKLYAWSKDNQTEIDKGWILKADTIKELAAKAKIDPASLENTVNEFNEFFKAGKDTAFGRDPKYSAPFATPPYYLTELCLIVINTQGGPQRDVNSRVLDYDNKPIPRLYAAGEFGSIYGFLYQGAGNVPEALAGRTAGKYVAAEKPWGATS
jgi:succinate dehydrogenase/fumarate reductase flavoprotein subunit